MIYIKTVLSNLYILLCTFICLYTVIENSEIYYTTNILSSTTIYWIFPQMIIENICLVAETKCKREVSSVYTIILTCPSPFQCIANSTVFLLIIYLLNIYFFEINQPLPLTSLLESIHKNSILLTTSFRINQATIGTPLQIFPIELK